MSKPGLPNGYRDELVAAQARVAALEEKLAERDHGNDDEDADPVIARLLERRRVIERTAQQGGPWWAAVVVLLLVMAMPAIPLLTLDHPDPTRVALSAVFCTILGPLLAWWMRFGVRRTAKASLAEADAKLVEARRMRNIERKVREAPAPAAEKRRVRVALEEDGEAEAEEEARAAEVQRRR